LSTYIQHTHCFYIWSRDYIIVKCT